MTPGTVLYLRAIPICDTTWMYWPWNWMCGPSVGSDKLLVDQHTHLFCAFLVFTFLLGKTLRGTWWMAWNHLWGLLWYDCTLKNSLIILLLFLQFQYLLKLSNEEGSNKGQETRVWMFWLFRGNAGLVRRGWSNLERESSHGRRALAVLIT